MEVYAKNTPVNIAFARIIAGKFAETDEVLKKLIEQNSKMIDFINEQQQRIGDLYQIIHEIAPEYEVIETMADTEEERPEMLARYMNHNEAYC